jgi:acyl carrier protein
MNSTDSNMNQIRSFIFRAFPTAKKRGIHDDSPLLESGIIDSLGMLDVVAFLEQTFEIKVEDEELVPDNFASMRALGDFVLDKKVHCGTV